MLRIDDPTASTNEAVDTAIALHDNTTGTILHHSLSPQLPDLVFSGANPLGPPDTWKLPSSVTVDTEKPVEASGISNSTKLSPQIAELPPQIEELPLQNENLIEPEQIRIPTIRTHSVVSEAPAELLGDIAFYDQPIPKTMSMIQHSHSVIPIAPKGQIQYQARSSLPQRRKRRRAAMDTALRLWVDG
jgi:hypothetical protein